MQTNTMAINSRLAKYTESQAGPERSFSLDVLKPSVMVSNLSVKFGVSSSLLLYLTKKKLARGRTTTRVPAKRVNRELKISPEWSQQRSLKLMNDTNANCK